LRIKPTAAHRRAGHFSVLETIGKIARNSIPEILETALFIFGIGVVQKVTGFAVAEMSVAVCSVIRGSGRSLIGSGSALRARVVRVDGVRGSSFDRVKSDVSELAKV
jgi:hypothetical protein